MNLFRDTWEAVRWVGRVSGAFFAVRPWTTAALVLAITTGRFANLLAFFLPLKVILLAGSPGVPRYFQFFIEPDEKMGWIIGLSLGAVGFYLLSLLMNSAGRALSQAGSEDVLQDANEIAATSRQREEARGYYASFSGISANGLIVLIGSAVLALINPLLLAVLGGLVVLQYLFSAHVIGSGDPLQPSPTMRMIRRNLGGYLNIFFSINFLAGFFVLLTPYLLGEGGNLLLALLSLLIMRQGLGAISSAVSVTTGLWRSKDQVNPMVFRHHQVQRRERLVTRNLRQVFARPDRETSARVQLTRAAVDVAGLRSEWRDSPVRGAYTFRLRVNGDSGDEVFFQQQVFPRVSLHLLEHEEFLFTLLPRETLKAPRVLARFEEGPFGCQICEYGQGEPLDEDAWKALLPELLQDHWSICPPAELVDAYRVTHPLLQERLKPAYLERLTVALNTPEDESLYAAFLERLPELNRVLAEMPLYLNNPDLSNTTVTATGDGRPLIMHWGRWSLEPVGFSLPRNADAESMQHVLDAVRRARELAPEQLTWPKVELVNQCATLEKNLSKARYEKGLKAVEAILSNPVLLTCR
ncbi:MAG: hypothetical protein JJT90_15730 [Ectothiorhodospiraceae bacterium]|nr:hypothetical protein [Ectothiorhodospiraceae bacterium]